MKVNRVHLKTVDSTNTWAKRNVSSLESGALTVITASEQTAGRGRGERTWVSRGEEDIKLTFAFTLPASQIPRAYLLSPLLSVTSRRALSARGIAGSQIKWPNDLLFGGCRKVGGILCEMEGPLGPSGDFFAALGIGLNVNSLPEALGVVRPVWPLSTLRAELGQPLDCEGLVEALVQEFSQALPVFFEAGFAPFKGEYDSGSALLGKRVRMLHAPVGGGAGVAVQGVVEGFGDDGRLLLRGEGGRVTEYLSGEVSGIELVEGEPMVEGSAQ